MDEPSDETPEVSPDALARHDFATSRKGFDQLEVRNYLGRIGRQVRRYEQTISDLEGRLREAETALAEAEKIDEERLTAVLGEEAAHILASAREAATAIREKTETKVERMLRDAQDEADRIAQAAEHQRAATLDEAEESAQGLVAGAERDAESVRDRAGEQAEDALESAREQRKAILEDLARRRRTGRHQLEQLKVGRDRLLEAYDVVRGTLEAASTELDVSLDEARQAALAVPPPSDIEESVVAGAAVDEDDDEQQDEHGDGNEQTSHLAAVPEPDEQLADVVAIPTPADARELRDEKNRRVFRRENRAEADLPKGDVREFAVLPTDEVESVHLVARTESGSNGDNGTSGESEVDDLFARLREGETPAPSGETPAPAVKQQSPSRRVVALFEAQAAAIDGNAGAASRTLKRVLADELNSVLDALRTAAADSSAAEIQGQVSYGSAVEESLDAAAVAGSTALVPGGASAAELDDVIGAVDDELGTTLRARVSTYLDEDRDSAPDRVRAIYREWRRERVETVAADALAGAFSRGMLAASGDSLLRWVCPPVGTPCSVDCEDNSLADPVKPGQEFPTGHVTSPLRSGCRCLVVPIDL